MKRLIWNKHTKLVAKHTAGWLFIVLGILGCFLPILQGILFLSIGVFLLADEIPFFGRIRDRLEQRFPKTAEYVHQKKKKLHDRLHRGNP